MSVPVVAFGKIVREMIHNFGNGPARDLKIMGICDKFFPLFLEYGYQSWIGGGGGGSSPCYYLHTGQ